MCSSCAQLHLTPAKVQVSRKLWLEWAAAGWWKRFPKPLVGHLGRQSNPLNFKAEERAQRRLDRLPFTARIERYKCSPQACLLSLQGWGLSDLLLRASNEGLLYPFLHHHTFSPKGVSGLSFTARIGRAQPHRARSASKKDGLVAPYPTLLRPRVARAQKIISLHPLSVP